MKTTGTAGNPVADAPETGRKANWCHGEMTCTCGAVIAHQDVIDAMNSEEMAHTIYEAESEQLTRPYRAMIHVLETALQSIAASDTVGGISAGERKGLARAAAVASAALAKVKA